MRSNADSPASLDITLDGGDLKDLDKIFSAPR
jgi:hypothetical protein